MTMDKALLGALETDENLRRAWENDALLHHAAAAGRTMPEIIIALVQRKNELEHLLLENAQRRSHTFITASGGSANT